MLKGINKTICKLFGHTSLIEKGKDDSCTVDCICNRCNKKVSNKILHQFDEWRNLDEKKCNQERTCKKCNTNEARVNHSFDSWTDLSNNNCEQTRQCQKCKYIEKKYNHSLETIRTEESIDFGYKGGVSWEEYRITEVSRCKRCGFIESEKDLGTVRRDT